MCSKLDSEKKFTLIKSLETSKSNSYVTIKGMITKFLNLYIYDACKHCKKKITYNNCFSCGYAGRSVKSLIVTIVIDDGSEAIHVKFFGLLSQKNLELTKSEKELLVQKSVLERIDSKLLARKINTLIGSIIVIRGKIIFNEFIELNECNAQEIIQIIDDKVSNTSVKIQSNTLFYLKERNAMKKLTGKNFGFVFPDTYDQAMSGLTTLVLASIVNDLKTWKFERFFLSYNPYVESTSLEYNYSFRDMYVLGFTIQFEFHYLNMIWLLKKGNIPLNNKKRMQFPGKYPIVIVGGPITGVNPYPLLDIVDWYFLGDAEESLPEFLNLLDQIGKDHFYQNISLFKKIKGF